MPISNESINRAATLIPPYGGELVDLKVPEEAREKVLAEASKLPSLQLSERQVCDLEMLAAGAFSPLTTFMNYQDYHAVLENMRLSSGAIFPLPITLSIEPFPELKLDRKIALRDSRNELLATLQVEEIYEWNMREMAERALGTADPRHPMVAEMHRWGPINLSGTLQLINKPRHLDFRELRLSPAETRSRLGGFGRKNIIAFQTRNPLHRVHEEITKRAVQETDGVLLLHPAVGMTKPGDVDHYTRVRTYKALTRNHYSPDRVFLSLIPLAMRLAGPREALWHAVIRRNYGANHLIVGRDHASPGLDSTGKPFYKPYAAQELVEGFAEELGVKPVAFKELVYLPEDGRFEEVDKVPQTKRTFALSGSQIRDEYLNNGQKPPDWYTRPEVAEILSEAHPPRYRQGLCVWFTGLSGSGKSTTAEVLTVLLLERGRQVTLLDGDVVRTHLSKGLGFSKEDRDTNIRRIGFVASEIVRHGGIAICAAISPYQATRNDVRNMVGGEHFVEVFVDTPLEICESRDTKGLYAKARRGEIQGFTGIDDPYERPENPEIILETVASTPEGNAQLILEHLIQEGVVREEAYLTEGGNGPH